MRTGLLVSGRRADADSLEVLVNCLGYLKLLIGSTVIYGNY